MNLRFIKKGIVAAAIVCAVFIPSSEAEAADIKPILVLPKQTKEVRLDQNVLMNAAVEISKNTTVESTIKIESTEEIKMNALLAGKAFAAVGENGYLLVGIAAEQSSIEQDNWTGKLYEASTVKVISQKDGWVEIESGDVKGFIQSEQLLMGKEALVKAKELLAAAYPETDIYGLETEKIESVFTVGETKEAEIQRLAEEEAKRIAEEEARKAEEEARRIAEELARVEAARQKGQAVVDFARQFIGNPYRYGGTSLTRGTDCSGFVKGVYANFGIYLPRTSSSMRSVGKAVNYSDIQPGDIVCYKGHVGIYAGNGQIVNAIGDEEGIGMSSAKYTKIITIRRIFY